MGFESRLGAVIYGVKLSSNRATKLDVVSHGAETCNLDAVNYGVDPQGPKLSLRRLGV
jgi:hypothetical protein